MRPPAPEADDEPPPRDDADDLDERRHPTDRGDEAAPGTAIFAGLDSAPALLLAVSGGPDSMALMHLAARWADALGATAPALHVATVDHGLRPGSADEAALVAAAATRLGLPHATLAWAGEKPRTRIQERARAARYALLAGHARAVGAPAILTAHHADDQAETVLMRLLRGSGIGGLGGMRRETRLAPGLALVRPLLDVSKEALVALCAAGKIATVDDPSNHDPAYARARLRAGEAHLAGLGLDRETLLRLGRRAARADSALETEVDRAVSLATAGDDAIDASALRDLQPEILLRLLRRRIEAAGPGRLRLERLERLTEALAAALRDGRSYRATLGGARVALDPQAGLVVTPAPARRARGSAPGRMDEEGPG